jgi:DNA polymerase-1
MKTLYVVDGYLYVYTSYYARMGAHLCSPSGEPTGASYVFIKTIFKLLKKYKPDMLCVAMDSIGRTFRKQMYEAYKGSRPDTMPDDMILQINRIIEILGIMNIPVYRLETWEADDIIGTIVEQALLQGEIETTICTRDKDVLQLVEKDFVDVLDLNKGIRTDVDAVFEKWGIHPCQFIEFLALQGDASDHVPGVPGIGPKTAVNLLQDWGDGDTIYKNLRSIKGKLGETLLKGKDLYALSKDLVTIRRDVPIEIDFEAMEVGEFEWTRLNEIFVELGFNSLIQARTKSGRRLC